MDLITYLKNTQNEELYEKLKTIVKLYKEREENHQKLITLNAKYNEFLTKKHEKEYNEKKGKDNVRKTTMLNPILLFFLLILLPTPISLIVCIGFNIFALVKLTKAKNKRKEKMSKDLLNNIANIFSEFNQDLAYEELCEVRHLYHTRRKELDEALLKLSDEDIELINDFYGALQEYNNLLSLLATDLEEEKPQLEHSSQLKQRVL